MRFSAQMKNVPLGRTGIVSSSVERGKAEYLGTNVGRMEHFLLRMSCSSLQIPSLSKENNTGHHGLRVWKGNGTGDQGEKRTIVSVETGRVDGLGIYEITLQQPELLDIHDQEFKMERIIRMCICFPPMFGSSSRIGIELD